MNHKIIFLIPVIFVLYACKKEKKPEFSGQYHPATNISVNTVVLYAANFSTTDTQFIQAYLNRTLGSYSYFNFSATPEPYPYSFTVNFLAGNQVNLVDSFQTVHTEIVSESDTSLTVAEIDSVSTWIPDNPSWCYKLYNKTTLVNPTKVCIPAMGGSFCKFRKLFVFRKKNGVLHVPLMTCHVGTGWTCFYATKDLRNIFNGGVLSELKPADTIVIQQKDLKLIHE